MDHLRRNHLPPVEELPEATTGTEKESPINADYLAGIVSLNCLTNYIRSTAPMPAIKPLDEPPKETPEKL